MVPLTWVFPRLMFNCSMCVSEMNWYFVAMCVKMVLTLVFLFLTFCAALSCQECESEISQKGALVSRLEAKTQEISRMLLRLNNHEQQRLNEQN